jgi:riboflavin biosynthesis pyrimidine reductase
MAALGQRQTGRASLPKRTVREETVWLFLTPTTASRAAQRATLDLTTGSQRKLRAHRCWLFDNHLLRQALSHALILRSRRSLRLEGGSSALWKLLRDGRCATSSG